MIADMIDQALVNLANLWQDVARSFERLATTFPAKTFPNENKRLDNPVEPQPTTGAAFVQMCDHVPANVQAPPKEAVRGEAQRILQRKSSINQQATLLDRFKAAILIFKESNNRADLATTATPDAITYFGGLADLLGKFNDFRFPNGPNPPARAATLELLDCQDRIDNIGRFITSWLEDAQELTEPTNTTQNFDIRGIRNSVDNLSTFPVLTADVGVGRSMATGGGGNSSGQGSTFSLRGMVNNALREVIGRVPRVQDTRSFLASLNQSFQLSPFEGRVVYAWTPHAAAGQTELGGGVTGGQASLYSRAQVSLKYALPLLEGLYALRDDADEELVTSSRNIVRSLFNELVGELGTEGGPRIARVDGLFTLLLEQPFTIPNTNPQIIAHGHLELLGNELGLTANRVNTLDEETDLTNFTALRDYVVSIQDSWNSFRDTLFGKDLGTRFVLLSRALSVTAESVQEIYEAMDSVFVGESERQVASFRDSSGRRVLVGELLSWIVDFATEEAPELVHEGGRRGVQAIIPTVTILSGLVKQLIDSINFEADLPDGMRQPRVQSPLRQLYENLQRVDRLATDVDQN